MSGTFDRFAGRCAGAAGSAPAFALALGLIVAWAASGPVLGFSEVWQLTVNTATTIVTFLMVFLIQNTQNRDAEAIHLKLDELIRAQADARDALIDIQHAPDTLRDEVRAGLQREMGRG